MSRVRRIGTISGAGGAAALTLALAVAVAAPSGALREVEEQASSALSNAQEVAVAPDGRYVYGVGFSSDDIAAFKRNATTGAITFDNAADGAVDGLDGPNSLDVSPDGDHIYVAGNGSASVHSLEVQPDGELNIIDVDLDGDGAIDGLAGAYDVVVSPNGDHVYLTGSSEDKIAAFHRGPDGELSWFDTYINDLEDIENLDDPRGMTFSPDGKHLYVTSADDGAVLTFRAFAGSGQLDFVETDTPFFSPAHDVAVSPNGTRVYVSFDDGVRTFSRNKSTGALTLIGLTPNNNGGGEPLSAVYGVSASPDGANVYAVEGNFGDGVASLKTRANATLDYLELDPVSEFTGPSGVEVSPDGRHVYLSGGSTGDGHIAVYSRQPVLELTGKKQQKASKLAVKAECSADCKVTITGKGVGKETAQLKAGKPKKINLDGPSGGKVTIKGKAKAGNRADSDKLKVTIN